jgi:tRNA threonylcarbamoyladenosine biosynthesis protein TsaB
LLVVLMVVGCAGRQGLLLVHGNAGRALECVRDLLQSQRVELCRVDAFAFASGPGAFTGLRVACALAQGLAYGCDRPVIAVNSLRTLALTAGAAAGTRVLAASDARMGQVYWAVFEAGASMRTLAPAALADPEHLAAIVHQWRPGVIVGDALQAFKTHWTIPGVATTATAAAAGPVLRPQARADAGAVAALAACDWTEGKVLHARDAVPEYVRDRVALTVAQRLSAAAESDA